MAQTTSVEPGRVVAESLDVSVAVAGTTTILEVPTAEIRELGIEFTVADNALDAFQVHGKMHPNGSFQVLYDAAGDYTSPAGLVIGASGDLTAQAAATTGWLFLDVSPLYAVKLVGSAAVGVAVVDVRAIGK